MMNSPAWNHRARTRAAAAAREAAAALAARDERQIAELAGGREKFALLVAELENNCKRISALPSGSDERKLLKLELLRYYRPLLEKYRADGVEFRNPVLVWCMIWSFDVGEIAPALEYAELCEAQHQPLPERFKTSLENFVADAIYDWAKAEIAAGRSADPYFEQQLVRVMDGAAYHVEVKIKYLKLIADCLEKSDDPAGALNALKLAEALDADKAKVKTAVARLEKELARRAAAGAQKE